MSVHLSITVGKQPAAWPPDNFQRGDRLRRPDACRDRPGDAVATLEVPAVAISGFLHFGAARRVGVFRFGSLVIAALNNLNNHSRALACAADAAVGAGSQGRVGKLVVMSTFTAHCFLRRCRASIRRSGGADYGSSSDGSVVALVDDDDDDDDDDDEWSAQQAAALSAPRSWCLRSGSTHGMPAQRQWRRPPPPVLLLLLLLPGAHHLHRCLLRRHTTYRGWPCCSSCCAGSHTP